MHEFRMPKLGLGDDEDLRVLEWLVPVGDPVEDGMPVVEVETDKAAMTVEADAAGVLAHVVVQEGMVVPPGAVLALIGEPGEAIDDDRVQDMVTTEESVPPAPKPPTPSLSPTRRTLDGADAPSASQRPTVRNGHLAGFPPATTDHAFPARVPDVDTSAAGRSTIVELDAHRRAVSRAMTASASVPQFAVSRSIDVAGLRGRLATLRETIAEATMTDLVIRAVGHSLQAVPVLNAWYLDGHARRFEQVNIALAVDGPRGVVAPVLHDVTALEPAQLCARRAAAVEQVRSGRVEPDALVGATFTVSNIGPLGADEIIPMLTPPQVGVLGLGRANRDSEGPGERVRFTLVADHRLVDGADSARFLAALHDAITDHRENA